jgi:hypothetical protein
MGRVKTSSQQIGRKTEKREKRGKTGQPELSDYSESLGSPVAP